MKSRRDIKRELDELNQEIARAGIGGVPEVAKVRRVGEGGECRPVGLHFECGGRLAVVVHEGDAPDPADLARYFPGGRVPLLIGGEADIAALL